MFASRSRRLQDLVQVKGKVLTHLGKRGQCGGGGGEGDGSFLRLCSGGLQYIGVRFD